MAYHVAVNAAEVTHHNLSISVHVFMGVATLNSPSIATVRLKLESFIPPNFKTKGSAIPVPSPPPQLSLVSSPDPTLSPGVTCGQGTRLSYHHVHYSYY